MQAEAEESEFEEEVGHKDLKDGCDNKGVGGDKIPETGYDNGGVDGRNAGGWLCNPYRSGPSRFSPHGLATRLIIPDRYRKALSGLCLSISSTRYPRSC